MIFKWFKIYDRCRIATGGTLSTLIYTDYEEDDQHKPLLTQNIGGGINGLYIDPAGYVMKQDNCYPKKGREFQEIELPYSWEEFNSMLTSGKIPKFIVCHPDIVGVTDIYGWIDRIEPVATKGPSTNTRIIWHVDYWLTLNEMWDWHRLFPTDYTFEIGFGRGRVKRGPADMARPDPSSPRMWVNAGKTQLKPPETNFWEEGGPFCIVMYTENTYDAQTPPQLVKTEFKIAWWPLKSNAYFITNSYSTITINRIYDGLIEECLGISPNAIVGVWFSPICPMGGAGSIRTHLDSGSSATFAWYERGGGDIASPVYEISYVDPIKTDDINKYMIVDPLGTVYATAPWGIEFDKIKMYLDIGTSGAWLNVIFSNTNTVSDEDGEGRRVQVPLISAPITSNDMSEYVYSGQREYDKSTARLQQEKNAWSGVANLGGGIVGGAIGGAIAGGPAGAVAGAGGGLISGTVGTIANFWLTEVYDSKNQDALDRLMSNQTANVLVAGGGRSWFDVGDGKWWMIQLSRDNESTGELGAEQSEFGYVTDVMSPDCTTLIMGGGPMRIENLQVRGDLTPEGKQYITALFNRGVYLDIINIS